MWLHVYRHLTFHQQNPTHTYRSKCVVLRGLRISYLCLVCGRLSYFYPKAEEKRAALAAGGRGFELRSLVTADHDGTISRTCCHPALTLDKAITHSIYYKHSLCVKAAGTAPG